MNSSKSDIISPILGKRTWWAQAVGGLSGWILGKGRVGELRQRLLSTSHEQNGLASAPSSQPLLSEPMCTTGSCVIRRKRTPIAFTG